MTEFCTERLVLRHWREDDREPFAAMSRDPEVMRHFPAPLTREQSDAFVDAQGPLLEERGWGLWVLEDRASGRFIGFTGLNVPRFDAHFTPAVEIGWRLARAAWGSGFASEAARGAVTVAFEDLELPELVSFTAVPNERSQRVMRRIGMARDAAGDFDHPSVADGSPLRRHVLYRLRRPDRTTRARPGA